MPTYGWDASDFDWGRGPMDLGAAARDGIVFFTHKATEGTRTKHVRYGEAMRRARAAGIRLVGAYVVPRTPGNGGHGSIQAQVNYLLAYLDAQTPWWRSDREFFLQVDTEQWGYDNVAPAYGAQMCNLLRKQTGKWVVHYAPRWAYGNSIPGDHPLWASAYGRNPAVHFRQAYRGDGDAGWAPYSGRTPVFLQFGSAATIGSQPGCDINAYRGSLDQLRALITGGDDDMSAQAEQQISEILNIVGAWADGREATWNGSKVILPNRWHREEVARDAAEATAVAGLRAAVDAMAAAIAKGGGSVDVAAITTLVDTRTNEVKALVEQRHAEEMAALAAERAAEVASLQAQLDALRPAQG